MKLWFTNHLNGDTCSWTILNMVLNVEEVDVGERLREFRNETERVSLPVCRVSISSFVGYLNHAVVDGVVSFKSLFYYTSATLSLGSLLYIMVPVFPLNQNHEAR